MNEVKLINAVEASKYISAEAASKTKKAYCSNARAEPRMLAEARGMRMAVGIINGMKSETEFIPVMHGEWDVVYDPYGRLQGFLHRHCGRFGIEAAKYCPNCGYKMKLRL